MNLSKCGQGSNQISSPLQTILISFSYMKLSKNIRRHQRITDYSGRCKCRLSKCFQSLCMIGFQPVTHMGSRRLMTPCYCILLINTNGLGTSKNATCDLGIKYFLVLQFVA